MWFQISAKLWAPLGQCGIKQCGIIANNCPSTVWHEPADKPEVTQLGLAELMKRAIAVVTWNYVSNCSVCRCQCHEEKWMQWEWHFPPSYLIWCALPLSLYIYFRSTPVSCSDSELLKNVQILNDRCNEIF